MMLGLTTAFAQIQDPVQFKTEWKKISDTEAQIVFTGVIDAGWHVYSTDLPEGGPISATFNTDKMEGVELDGKLMPEGKEIEAFDKVFEMKLRYFEEKATFVQKLKITAANYFIEGYLEYGSCNDENCLPPTEVPFTFSGQGAAGAPAAAPAEEKKAEEPASNVSSAVSTADYWTPVVDKLNAFGEETAQTTDQSWFYIFFAGFIGGLLALFTPCVWPIIPMTVSFFLKRSKDKKKGIRDAWTYGASIVVIYVTLGLAITLIFGASALNALSTNAVFNILFFLMLVVFAASFFGAFEITLPSKWSNAVDSKAEQTSGLLSIFLMAFTLSLVSFSFSGQGAAGAPAAAPAKEKKVEEPANNVSSAVSTADYWTPVVDKLNAFGEETSQTTNQSWFYIFFAGFIGGLLALFTPCVWPIIPMTVSFFLKRSKDKKKGIRDAWTYGASIVVIYVTLGLAITLIFGASALNALSTNAVFNILFFLMLVVFAASFFGAFEITLPSKWSNAVDSKAEQTSGLLSIFLMAFTLSLVSFSCTGPIIGFLLVDVSTTGSGVAPAIGMLGFALALALPFTLFAMFPSWLKQMPKSGGWMNVIKVTLGFLELAFALKFLSVADLAYGWRILDRETFLALWIVIFGLLGFYLLGKIKFPHDDDEDSVSVPRFFMALCSLAFAVYMVPGLWGAPLKAVSAFAPPMNTQDFNLYKNEVHAQFDDFDAGMEYAKRNGKPVMLDFTGYGCVNCRKMELSVWTDSKVSKLIQDDYVLITLYVDNKTPLPEHIKVMENGKERTLRTLGDKWSYLQRVKFGANAQPFYVLIDNEGNPLNKSYSFDENVANYVDFLETGLKNYKK